MEEMGDEKAAIRSPFQRTNAASARAPPLADGDVPRLGMAGQRPGAGEQHQAVDHPGERGTTDRGNGAETVERPPGRDPRRGQGGIPPTPGTGRPPPRCDLDYR